MVRLDNIIRCLVPSLLWMASSCAINERKGPNLPKENKNTRTSDATVIVTTGTQRDGRQLYDRYCEDCHNIFEKTTKRGVTTDDILRGIDRVPAMSDLDRLKISDLTAISQALK